MATTSNTLSAERRVVMNKFKECNQCLHEFNDKNLEPCKDCVPKKKTNADRIRSMSIQEMSTDLVNIFEELFEDGVPSPEWMEMWLQSEAE